MSCDRQRDVRRGTRRRHDDRGAGREGAEERVEPADVVEAEEREDGRRLACRSS